MTTPTTCPAWCAQHLDDRDSLTGDGDLLHVSTPVRIDGPDGTTEHITVELDCFDGQTPGIYVADHTAPSPADARRLAAALPNAADTLEPVTG